MTLIADRFVREGEGRVFDLATGREVTLVETRVRSVSEQCAAQDRCAALIAAQMSARRAPGSAAQGAGGAAASTTAEPASAVPDARSVAAANARNTLAAHGRNAAVADARKAAAEARDVAVPSAHSPESPPARLIDFSLVGESRWIEAYAADAPAVGTPEAASMEAASVEAASVEADSDREATARVVMPDALGGVVAALDGISAGDVRRLYVRAPRGVGLTTFLGCVAREARARGFVPVCPAAIERWPRVVDVLRRRSVLLLADRDVDDRQATRALARAIGVLTRGAATVVALVSWVSDRARVAALMLPWRAHRTEARGIVAMTSAVDSGRRLSPVARAAEASPIAFGAAPDADGRDRTSASGRLPGRDASAVYPLEPRAGERALWRDHRSRHRGRQRSTQGSVHDASGSDAHAATGSEMHRMGPKASAASIAPVQVAGAAGAVAGAGDRRDASIDTGPFGSAADEPVIVPMASTVVSGYGDAVDSLVARGRWAAAERALRGELGSHDRRRRLASAARTAVMLGRLCLARGRPDEALRWLDHAGERASSAGHAALIADALRWSGVAALDQADLERSERLLRTALAAAGPVADPVQVFAIELALARCLFWQGRFDAIVLPPCVAVPGVVAGGGVAGGTVSADQVGGVFARASRDPASACEAVGDDTSDRVEIPRLLRVERWRRAARLALVQGDFAQAGDAVARACRLTRGDDEEAVRAGGCRADDVDVSRIGDRRAARALRGLRSARGDETVDADMLRDERRQRSTTSAHDSRAGRRSDGTRSPGARSPGSRTPDAIAADLRAACHLEAARVQLAIGDWSACDAHLRVCRAAIRAPARAVRLHLLMLARVRGDRLGEARRREERLIAALRQAHVPRLVRVRARYLVESRARRAGELSLFLERYGETALAGRTASAGGSPMLDAFQAILHVCHETPDDLAALARVSAFLQDRLQAATVAVYGAVPTPAQVPAPPCASASTLASASSSAPASGSASPSTSASQASDSQVSASASGSSWSCTRLAVAGSVRLASAELAARTIDTGQPFPLTYRADALDAAAPIRFGGRTIGAVIVRWIIDARVEPVSATSLIRAAAAALGPPLRAVLDRAPEPSGDPSSTGAASRKTLGLLGASAPIESLRQTIVRVASAPFHVLIEGESGSGKELVARALHQHGPRRLRRFCAINCAALTDELLEAELFGHVRGAFTGAVTERAGLFEEADGGTLFLDEIGELSSRGQAKLLRVIQDGETRRIGENLPRRVDARIVAATNRALRREAAAGRFRVDLLYRLDVIRIAVPPLRARPEDVVVLARAFWAEAVARTGSRATLDPDALARLARYHWPGNVRELHNVIMALAVHAPPRGRVTASMLPPFDAAPSSAPAEPVPGDAPPLALDVARREFEARFVRAALVRTGGHQTRAARDLGLTRQGLRKVMERLGLGNGRRSAGEGSDGDATT